MVVLAGPAGEGRGVAPAPRSPSGAALASPSAVGSPGASPSAVASPGASPSQASSRPPTVSGNPAEEAAVLAAFNAFTQHMSSARFVEGFRLVRGVRDVEARATAFAHRLDEINSFTAFYDLSKCESNLATLASWAEAYGRDRGTLPSTLAALMPMYLTELPTCPAHGRYVYSRRGREYRLFCSGNAHSYIGVKRDEPSYSSVGGLSARHTGLTLSPGVHIRVKNWSSQIVDHYPAYDLYIVQLQEESSSYAADPFLHRQALFVMTREDGRWKVDMGLSNRDMVFVYDLERWQKETALPKQILYYFQYMDQMSRGTMLTLPGLPDRAHLELQICESNLRGLALAVENWSVQHEGAYPKDAFVILSTLRGRLPECPAGGRYRYALEQRGRYVISCCGKAHAAAGVPENLPSISPLGVRRTNPKAEPRP